MLTQKKTKPTLKTTTDEQYHTISLTFHIGHEVETNELPQNKKKAREKNPSVWFARSVPGKKGVSVSDPGPVLPETDS